MVAPTAMTGSGTVEEGRLWMPEIGTMKATATVLLMVLDVDTAKEIRAYGR